LNGLTIKGYPLMYLVFHGFREKPFNLTPDPRFVYLSETHREAFAHLLYGINNRAGFIVLTGEVGSGKTTALRALLSQLPADRYHSALILNPSFSPSGLLRIINRELGIPASGSDQAGLLEALNQFLLEQKAKGHNVVLIIDEAQGLEAPVLEQIRLISNLETDQEKLIQIVLSGQPELLRILGRNEMRQLNQRITVRYHLKPMSFQDTVSYINHRLDRAGGRGKVVFSRRAIKRIYRYSGGLPRLINAACDRALLAGYIRDTGRISHRIAAAAIKDMRGDLAPYPRKGLILIPAFVMMAALFLADIHFKWLTWHDLIDPFKASSRIEATEERTTTDPIINGEELSRIMTVEIGGIPESESARRAFNTLATYWKVPPVPENESLNQVNRMDRALLDGGLRLYRFSGNLGVLLRIDYPAVLELTLPGIPGKRFIALVGRENEKLFVEPPVAGRRSFSFNEIEKHWSGRALLLWRDPLNLLASVSPGSRGSSIRQLQDLLREAGTTSSPLTGIFDGDTVLAVKEFQSSRGIEQDGLVGDQTLMLLYGSINRFEVPRLSVREK
jgi:general secretion pathway protein A